MPTTTTTTTAMQTMQTPTTPPATRNRTQTPWPLVGVPV